MIDEIELNYDIETGKGYFYLYGRYFGEGEFTFETYRKTEGNGWDSPYYETIEVYGVQIKTLDVAREKEGLEFELSSPEIVELINEIKEYIIQEIEQY